MERTWQNLFSKPLAAVCYDAARTKQCRPVRGCDLSWEVCLPVPD